MKLPKKIFVSAVAAVIGVSLITACGPSSKGIADTSASADNVSTTFIQTTVPPHPSAVGSDYIKYEAGEYTIVLGYCDKELTIHERYERYLPYITDELIRKADKNIFDVLGNELKSANLYLHMDNEGYLCIRGEVIRKIYPPKTVELEGETITAGCGIDHEHVFVDERISNKKQY